MPQPQNWLPDLSQPQPGSDAALALGWAWPAARAACDDHKRGEFALSWQLWLDMDGLPAIRAAKGQRVVAADCLPYEAIGPTRAPGRLETEAAQTIWKRHLRRLLRSTLSDLIGMGFSLWQHPTATNPATLRREVITVERWPISQVRYTATPFPDVWQPGRWIERYYAIQFGVGDSVGAVMYGPQTLRQSVPTEAYLPGGNGVWVRFVQLPRPGQTDGHWTMVGNGDQPHLDASVLSLDVSYVGGAIMTRSMYSLSKTLGRQSPVAELPGTTPVTDPAGRATEAVVAGLGVTAAGAVLPGGVKLNAFSLTAQNAALFPEFSAITLENVELAILGRSGTMAKEDAQYQAKDGPAQRVPEKLVRADVATIERAASQLFQVLANANTEKPGRIYLDGHMPDTEQDARVKAQQERELKEAEKLTKFWAAFYAERDNGFDFPPTPDGQARLDVIAKRCGVDAPRIPKQGLPPPLVKVPKPTVPITGEAGAALPPPPGAP